MASKFKTGEAADRALKARSGGGGSNFTPELFWREGDERYVQFITEWDKGPVVPAYKVNVKPEAQKAWMQTFIDPRPVAEALKKEGKEVYNPLFDRWGYEPREKKMVLAVVLKPVKTGRRITGFEVEYRTWTNKDGEERTAPNVGLIIDTNTFFGPLSTFWEDKGTITDRPYKVVKIDKRQISFVPQEKDQLVDLEDDVLNAFDLDELEDQLMSAERYHALIDPIPDGAEPDHYQSKRIKDRQAKVAETREKAESAPDEENTQLADSFQELQAKFAPKDDEKGMAERFG